MSTIIKSKDGKIIVPAPNVQDWSSAKGNLTENSIFFRSKHGIFSVDFEEEDLHFIQDVKKNKSVILSYLDKENIPVIDEIEVLIN